MVGKSGLQFAQVAVLARLLAPADFGLMAMVLMVMAFIQVFTDLGVSNAIIHHQNIHENQLSSLYWVSVVMGLILALGLIASSGIISSKIFKQPEMQPILKLLSASIFLSAISQQLRVMAEKSLRFEVLAKIEVVSSVIGFLSAIGWAFLSPSVYALVAGVLFKGVTQTLLLWLLAADGWRPKFRLNLGEVKPFLKFGGYMMANNFINSFNAQADILIAGRLFPAATLGIYTLPRSLCLSVAGAINPVITRVGLPVMAKAQDDKALLRLIYLKTMRMTASINFPIYILMAVFSKEVVCIIFGSNWAESAPLLVFLAVWGLFRSCLNPVGSLLLAIGKANLSFKWNLSLLIFVPPALWVGGHWGIVGLALMQTVLTISLMIPAWYFLIRPSCGASGLEYAFSILSPLVSSLLAILVAYFVVFYFVDPLWRLVWSVMVAISAYFVLSYFFNREWLLAMRQLIANK